MTSANTRSARRRHRRLACLLGAGLVALVSTATATATVPIGDTFRVSTAGTDGSVLPLAVEPASAHNARTGQHLVVWSVQDPAINEVWGRLINGDGTPAGDQFRISAAGVTASQPAVAYNPRTNEFMIAWRGQPVPGEDEVYVQRLSAAGALVGTAQRITNIGPDGNAAHEANTPAITVNETRNEYLVAFLGTPVPTKYEVYAQRLSADGSQVGPDDQRISEVVPLNPAFDAQDPAVAWNERRDEYMFAWQGDDNTGGYVDNENDIHVQRLAGDSTPLGARQRISDMGPVGNPAYDADDPAIAYNPATDEYLVAFDGTDDVGGLVAGEREMFVQRLSYDGTQIGTDDQRISDMGGIGNAAYDAQGAAVAYNQRANEYLVTWFGDDDTAPLLDNKNEVFAQRLSATAAELDGNDIRTSVTAPDGDATREARRPAVSYDSQANGYLVAWLADPAAGALVDNESEIYARRFGAGTAVAAAAAQCKVLPAPTPPPKGDPSKVTLTVNQLLINQRIDQAAIRRANGVQGWIDAGVETRDLCQGIVSRTELYAGSLTGYTGLPYTLGQPDPRPVTVPAAQPGDPSKVTLSVNQLLINQRISQAAIRRLNALKVRLDGGLTGGDIDDGAVGRAQLVGGTRVLFTPLLTAPPAASTTTIAPATPGDPSKVKLTTEQVLINQRISQAAVKRANDLIYRLGQGIGPEEIKDGSLTAADLAPGLPASTTP